MTTNDLANWLYGAWPNDDQQCGLVRVDGCQLVRLVADPGVMSDRPPAATRDGLEPLYVEAVRCEVSAWRSRRRPAARRIPRNWKPTSRSVKNVISGGALVEHRLFDVINGHAVVGRDLARLLAGIDAAGYRRRRDAMPSDDLAPELYGGVDHHRHRGIRNLARQERVQSDRELVGGQLDPYEMEATERSGGDAALPFSTAAHAPAT